MPHRELNILLVEDSEDDVFFFKRSLVRASVSAQVKVAGDGDQAVAYLTDSEGMVPDIIFLDLKMPNQNGFEFLEWLKNQSALNQTRIIILTSSSEPKERQRAEALGVSDYFIKPITPQQLRDVAAQAESGRML